MMAEEFSQAEPNEKEAQVATPAPALHYTDSTMKLPTQLYVLGGLIVFGFFANMVSLMFLDIPPDNIASLNQLFGNLSTSFGIVVGYFFGSSVGSQRNGQALREIMEKQVTKQ